MTLVFSADETAREVAETLARKGIENDEGREGSYRFLTTGDPAAFREMGKRFLQLPISEVEHVDCRRPRRRRHDPGAPADAGDHVTRHDGRRPDQLRELDLQPDFLEQPHGSILYAQGRTVVLCTATVEEDIPRWLRGKGRAG